MVAVRPKGIFGMFSLKRLSRDENGATAIEYGLIAALVATVIIAGISAFGVGVNNLFNTITNAVLST